MNNLIIFTILLKINNSQHDKMIIHTLYLNSELFVIEKVTNIEISYRGLSYLWNTFATVHSDDIKTQLITNF